MLFTLPSPDPTPNSFSRTLLSECSFSIGGMNSHKYQTTIRLMNMIMVKPLGFSKPSQWHLPPVSHSPLPLPVDNGFTSTPIQSASFRWVTVELVSMCDPRRNERSSPHWNAIKQSRRDSGSMPVSVRWVYICILITYTSTNKLDWSKIITIQDPLATQGIASPPKRK